MSTFTFPRTPDKKALVFSPWEVRPGEKVNITRTYVDLDEIEWNSGEPITFSYVGTVFTTSIKGPYEIPAEDISINSSASTVTIQKQDAGIITLSVYRLRSFSETKTARAAINEDDASYYNDWFYDELGNAVPMTVVEYTQLASEKLIQLEDFTVEYPVGQRGISVLEGEIWTSTLTGTVKMTDDTDAFSMSRNLFRKGLKEVVVPLDCTIEPIIRYQTELGARIGKVVEVDLQDKEAGDPNDYRGILWHRDFLYILTNTGLHRFDRWGNLDRPDDSFSDITGNDLTYTVNDQFLITSGSSIKVYRLRHDFLHLDRTMGLLRSRQDDPDAYIGEESA